MSRSYLLVYFSLSHNPASIFLQAQIQTLNQMILFMFDIFISISYKEIYFMSFSSRVTINRFKQPFFNINERNGKQRKRDSPTAPPVTEREESRTFSSRRKRQYFWR